MKDLAETKLRSFTEKMLGQKIHVFGNIAVAISACEMIENDTDITRSAEMMLLTKTEGQWQIVSQTWDREAPSRSIPADLLGGERTGS